MKGQSPVVLLAALLVVVIAAIGAAGHTSAARQAEERDLDFLREKVREYYPQLANDEAEALARLLLKAAYEQRPQGRNVSAPAFPCEVYGPSDPVPTSAKLLRPADVKVLAALGDSLTAGFGALASTIFTLFNDYRGVSYAIGGDGPVDKVFTLGTILRLYNPDIRGLSTGTGDVNSATAHLNLAVTGATVQGLASQVRHFIERAKADPGIDFANDWKVVSVLIGNNNLCAFCNDATANGPETFGRLLEESMDILYEQVPRVFVNLLSPVDVTTLYSASEGLCWLLHLYECSCGVSSDEKVRDAVSQAHVGYYKELERVAGLDKYSGREDFALVVQPFLLNTSIPTRDDGKPDTSYLAPDCFHFSEKSHQAAAVGLWNNMIETEKQTSWVPGEPIECPPAGAVFPTREIATL